MKRLQYKIIIPEQRDFETVVTSPKPSRNERNPLPLVITDIHQTAKTLGFSSVEDLCQGMFDHILENDGFFTVDILLTLFLANCENQPQSNIKKKLVEYKQLFESKLVMKKRQTSRSLKIKNVDPWVKEVSKAPAHDLALEKYFRKCMAKYLEPSTDTSAEIKEIISLGYSVQETNIKEEYLASFARENIVSGTYETTLNGNPVALTFFYRHATKRDQETLVKEWDYFISRLGRLEYTAKKPERTQKIA